MSKVIKKIGVALSIAGLQVATAGRSWAGPFLTYEFFDLNISQQQCYQRADQVLREAGLQPISNLIAGDSSYVYAHGEDAEFTVFLDCSQSAGNNTRAILFVGGDDEAAYGFRAALSAAFLAPESSKF